MKDGGYLFPQDEIADGKFKRTGGITVRQFFAVFLLKNLLDSSQILSPQDHFNMRCIKNAYKLADAMIAEGEKYEI